MRLKEVMELNEGDLFYEITGSAPSLPPEIIFYRVRFINWRTEEISVIYPYKENSILITEWPFVRLTRTSFYKFDPALLKGDPFSKSKQDFVDALDAAKTDFDFRLNLYGLHSTRKLTDEEASMPAIEPNLDTVPKEDPARDFVTGNEAIDALRYMGDSVKKENKE